MNRCVMMAQENHVNIIDVNSLVRRVVSSSGIGLDSVYSDYISRPSKYYGDFYGVQILKNVGREEIRSDFKVVSETDTTVTVKIAGELIVISDMRYMQIMDIVVPYPHIVFEGDDFREFTGRKELFCGWLSDNSLCEKYLLRNGFYEKELEVERRWNRMTVETLKDTILEDESNCIHIYMDRVHGDSVAFEEFLSFVSKHDFDWIGIEMMDSRMQEVADRYIFSEPDSEEYAEAKETIFEYYSSGWIRHFNDIPDSFDENPFCRLMSVLRNRKIKVYAMEKTDEMFLLFRNGESEFGGAVRSAVWAETVPVHGRGVVFGGSAHFTDCRGVNFQDFYHDRAPGQEIVIVNNKR